MIAMMGFVMGVNFRGLGQWAGPQGIAAGGNSGAIKQIIVDDY
jgi:hypothetical protein